MTHRRRFIAQLSMAAGAVTVFRPFLSFAHTPQSVAVLTNTLHLLHTADLNGQAGALENAFRGLGGAATLQSALQGLKKEMPSALVVHVGNVANAAKQSRSECLRLYKTLCDAGYDAVVPGESDLAKGHPYFEAIAEEAGLPLCNDTAAGLLPHRMLKKGQFVIGLINASAVHNSKSGLQSAMVNKTAASLRSSGCTVVVCLAHKMSVSNKHTLANASSGVDVIMGCAEKPSLHNAEIVCNGQGTEVVLSRAVAHGVTVSCLALSHDVNGKRTDFSARNHFVGAEDQTLSTLMYKYKLSYV